MRNARAGDYARPAHHRTSGRDSFPAVGRHCEPQRAPFPPEQRYARSLPDLNEINCKLAWTVDISPLSVTGGSDTNFQENWCLTPNSSCKIDKICPRPAEFSFLFFKPDRLLEDETTGAEDGSIPVRLDEETLKGTLKRHTSA